MGSGRRRTTILLVLLCCYSAPREASSLSFSLNFSDPSVPNRGASIVFSNDASISSSRLELTKNTRDANIQYSTGRASYVDKVPLWNSATGEMASFTTTFVFQITPDKESLPNTGDGMAFFLGHFPSEIPPNSNGGSLGLLPAFTNGTGDSRIVAVEFDTFLNPQNADISRNHVGIDVNSVNSTASTDTATWPGKNLTSSNVMTATVNYRNDSKLLTVDLLIGDALYQVNATIDLSRHLPEEVAVGFSAATGWAAELHQILSWSFSSTLQLEEAPPPAEPPLPTTSTSRKKTLVILLSVLFPLLLLLVCAAVVAWRRHKKTRSIGANEDRSTDSDSEEQCVDRADLERGVAAGGPRRYTYRELAAATSNFAEEEKLGRGGFGSVYRGHLLTAVGGDPGGRPVAVKMLSAESSAQGRKEFEAEASQPCPAAGLVRQPQGPPARLRARRGEQPRQAPLQQRQIPDMATTLQHNPRLGIRAALPPRRVGAVHRARRHQAEQHHAGLVAQHQARGLRASPARRPRHGVHRPGVRQHAPAKHRIGRLQLRRRPSGDRLGPAAGDRNPGEILHAPEMGVEPVRQERDPGRGR